MTIRLVLLALAFAGCASKPGVVRESKRPAQAVNCEHINWKQMGIDDAMVGKEYSARTYKEALKTCAGRGDLAENKELYAVGVGAGQRAFCTRENGLKLGRKRAQVKDRCPPPSWGADFYSGYEEGLKQPATR